MFPETYNYKNFTNTDTTVYAARVAQTLLYTKAVLTSMTKPTYTEEGFIYGQQGLKW